MRKRLGAAFKCAEPVLFNYRGRYYVEVWIVRLNHLVWGRKERGGPVAQHTVAGAQHYSRRRDGKVVAWPGSEPLSSYHDPVTLAPLAEAWVDAPAQ